MSSGIGRGGIVIYHLITIFANQIRAAGQAKLNRLAKRVLNPVLEACSTPIDAIDEYLTRSNVKFVTRESRGSQ